MPDTSKIKYYFQHWPPVRFVRRRRQKYIRLRVSDGAITVSAPMFTSIKEMEQFLIEKKGWVDTILDKIDLKNKNIEELHRKNGSGILLRGSWKPLVPVPGEPGITTELIEEDDRVLFTSPAGHPGRPSLEAIQNFYRKRADVEIRQRLEEQASALPFSYNKVFIRSQKTKWGTCSAKGHLSFNWRLIKSPLFVWDYLIVHELCHTVHMNHSRDFWELVKKYYPDYTHAKRWITENGPLVFSDP